MKAVFSFNRKGKEKIKEVRKKDEEVRIMARQIF